MCENKLQMGTNNQIILILLKVPLEEMHFGDIKNIFAFHSTKYPLYIINHKIKIYE